MTKSLRIVHVDERKSLNQIAPCCTNVGLVCENIYRDAMFIYPPIWGEYNSGADPLGRWLVCRPYDYWEGMLQCLPKQ